MHAKVFLIELQKEESLKMMHMFVFLPFDVIYVCLDIKTAQKNEIQ